MKYHIPYYYKRFVCLGGECPDTCCGGWKIAVDDESLSKYRQVAGRFGERLRRGIDPVMQAFRMNGRYCEFLNEKGLCDIFRELGRDGLCRACRDYPRHQEDYGMRKEIMLSMSCPEAARLILEDDSQGAGFEYIPRKKNDKSGVGGNKSAENGTERSRSDRSGTERSRNDRNGTERSRNDRNGAERNRNDRNRADRKRTENGRTVTPADREEAQMLSWLLELRETLICLVRDRSVDWEQRLVMILAFGHDFQRHWDKIRQGEERQQAYKAHRLIRRLAKRYLSDHAAASFAERMVPYQNRGTERMIRMTAWMRQLQQLEPVLEHWSCKQERVCRALYHRETPKTYEKLLRDFGREAAAFEQEWENLVLYYLRTYLLGALYDDDVYGKIKMAVFSYAVIREWCLFRYRLTGTVTIDGLTAAAYRYSREIENSDRNIEELEWMMEENPLFYLESMITVICGAQTS